MSWRNRYIVETPEGTVIHPFISLWEGNRQADPLVWLNEDFLGFPPVPASV